MQFSDDVIYTVDVAEGEGILAAALAQDVPVLHQCQSGSCGSCVCHLAAGKVEMRKDMSASLLKSEQDAGMRLACISQAFSDSVLDFDYDSKMGEKGPINVTVFIDSIDWLSDDVIRLNVELADGQWFDFKPGQFAQIQVPGTNQVRRYSMSSSPEDLPKIEFLIRILPEGLMSDYIRDTAKVDDALEIEGAFGSFFLRDISAREPHIMIAGGTGLAPIMSMLDAIRKKNGIKPSILLSFGCLNSSSLFHVDELELRTDWMPTLKTRISLNQGEAENNIIIGNPLQALQPSDVTAEDTVAYLCGPPGMISAAHSMLEGFGLKPENIHAEQFVASE